MKKVEITNSSVKKNVLTYFFDRVNYYDYRYIILKNTDDLIKYEKNIEYVIPHIKGDPYFLVVGTIGTKNFSILIEKKKLKFNIDQCVINDIRMFQIDLKCMPKTYIGSIFDGRLLDNQESKDIFLIQECYYLDGIKMNAWKLEKKIEYINEYISKNIKSEFLKIRKYDHISNLLELDNKISKSKIEINGFIFYQARSGVSYLFVDNEHFKYETNVFPENNITNNNVSIDSENIFILKKDAKPDIYHIYSKDNKLIHIASIPDSKTSQMVFEALKGNDYGYFKCELDSRWKRYKPIEYVTVSKT